MLIYVCVCVTTYTLQSKQEYTIPSIHKNRRAYKTVLCLQSHT